MLPLLLVVFGIFITNPLRSEETGKGVPAPLKLMPLPRSVTPGTGHLTLDEHFTAAFAGTHDARLNAALDRMVRRLDRQCGGVLRSQHLSASGASPVLTLKVAGSLDNVQSIDEDESYQLNVSASQATLTATTDLGAMHGMETFLQLLSSENGSCQLPVIAVDDAPRFRWRGLMIDVSRHFEPVEVIERTLDGMAVAKLNVFHWHLSDDQGFRAESKKFPRLTEVGSGGEFYTQDQMREVVAYAHARGIRVVPEFDMPGHSSSWILSYPEYGSGEHITELPTVFGIPHAELDPSNEKTYKFIDAFVGEMAAIFPDAYFHIGGDETKGTGWLENPRIADFMQKKGFKTPAELQAYFNQRLLPILTKHGKKMVGWDEILNPALPKDIMIQSWRGDASLSSGATQGYQGILSAPYYLDAQKTSEVMFLADPLPADTTLTAAQQQLILGGEVCMWAEQLDPETVDSRIWPRTIAIAERFWSPQSDRDVADMYRRLNFASMELEDVGLTHISGPEKLRRNLLGSRNPEPLDILASVTEPVSFHERYQGQHTDRLTSLDRLVDAVVADPPLRQEIANEVDAIISPSHTEDSERARIELRRRFAQWEQAAPILEAWARRSGRLSDTEIRARQLGALGQIGLESLAYLDTHTPAPSAWLDSKMATIADTEKPSALVRFVFLPSLRKLAQAASNVPTAEPQTQAAGGFTQTGVVSAH
ncbi:beta-N-acetylhexosaminidase [Acidicapsa acidisoli]|uniref:beta-N-acetylhexosaminidase n=1 Tax=Acidicapsa acidisoli TaxID=1615681 RepID=UPI0021DF5192|nr:beta-N-acetylhexosaminidase [Acidicapsa acidisoli]